VPGATESPTIVAARQIATSNAPATPDWLTTASNLPVMASGSFCNASRRICSASS
jgi:hypothetical protein